MSSPLANKPVSKSLLNETRICYGAEEEPQVNLSVYVQRRGGLQHLIMLSEVFTVVEKRCPLPPNGIRLQGLKLVLFQFTSLRKY